MKIAVLSGKGGTGKTTVSVNLSIVAKNSMLIDCDVEEPNTHIFLNPEITEEISVKTDYPVIDKDKCDLCGKCGDFCNYNSIIPAKNTVLVFKEICHDCGGCKIVCPQNAISYEKREIGKIYGGIGKFGNNLKYGALNIGEMSGVKIIKKLYDLVKEEELVIIDSPPGTSCATVAAVEDCDYVIIIAEPTPFGVSDMKMVVEMLKEMKKPFGLVINKAGLGDDEIYKYCEEEDIKILEEIPYEKEIAQYYAKGIAFSTIKDWYKDIFIRIFEEIKNTKY